LKTLQINSFPSISTYMFLNYYLRGMLQFLNKILAFLFSVPVHLYRYFISPLIRPACRHEPSCSQYALDALRMHGPLRGLMLGTNRILRCRPGGTHGFDPVPFIWIRRYRPWRSWLRRWPKCNRLKRWPLLRQPRMPKL